ncbi:MAG: cell division protein FtsQ [Solirubrobacteraceae bacterium]|nr:cell division protein FtsQ [Solirubrobacteraceae bacterium]
MRVVVGFACVLVILGAAWLWLRDSSLVAVKRVTVTGVSGPDAPRVREALQTAALGMTTMHVRDGDLANAVEPFPGVLGVKAETDLPHTLRLTVRERNPVGAVVAGNQRVPVAADGTVMRTARADGLPDIAAKAVPGGSHATDPGVRRALSLLSAAPPALRGRVRRVYVGPKGLTVPLRSGPTLYFGGSERTRAKWAAATVVLADPTSTGATYLDLRLPERPAAGGLEAAPEPADTQAGAAPPAAAAAAPAATAAPPAPAPAAAAGQGPAATTTTP